ncbi:MAG: pirin family protein [Planctomycetota bacterium]|nr:pirin family protein [Planctomycetota bacterium]
MIAIRKSAERGHFDHGWLDTRHTFSFGAYQDPAHEHFRALRVLNEDRVKAGLGFGTHGHRDMEIVTYVLDGALGHRDSLGNGSVLRAGDLQRMTAGTGIRHSEFNPSPAKGVHFYQLWLFPERAGLTPSYEELRAPARAGAGLRLVAAPDGRDGAMAIHQDARIYLAKLKEGGRERHALAPGRHAWLQVLRGNLSLNGEELEEGDGAALSDVSEILLAAGAPAEAMLFDLA